MRGGIAADTAAKYPQRRAVSRRWGVTTGATSSAGTPQQRPGASLSATGTPSGTGASIATKHASAPPDWHRRRASPRPITAVTFAISIRRRRVAKIRPSSLSVTTTIREALIDFITTTPCSPANLARCFFAYPRATSWRANSGPVGISFFCLNYFNILGPTRLIKAPITG
jgi:hypothetical protein